MLELLFQVLRVIELWASNGHPGSISQAPSQRALQRALQQACLGGRDLSNACAKQLSSEREQSKVEKMQGLRSIAYNTLFKRNSVYVGFIIAGAVAGEAVVDNIFDSAWENQNKGVCIPVYVARRLL